MSVRVAAMGRTRDAEVLGELEDGRVRVRYADNGRVAVVPAGKVVARGEGASARVRPPSAIARPSLPPMLRASQLLPPPSRPFEPGATRPVPKPTPPARSRRYLAFVRAHACVYPGCGKPGPSEASHHGPHAISVKASDYRAIPLCTEDHRGHHDGRRPALTPAFIAETQRDLLVEFLDLEEAS